MVDVRRYYTEQGSPLSQEDILATQAITAEPTEEEPIGPTTDMPFRYTEQALNPRGAAVTGQAQRDPRARSAYTGIPAGAREAMADAYYQGQYPMVMRQLAMGDVSQYKDLEGFGEIGGKNSVYGRSLIAQLPGFEGPTQSTMMFDMQRIGKAMGFSDEKIEKMMGYKSKEAGWKLRSPGRDEQLPGGLNRWKHYTDEEKQALVGQLVGGKRDYEGTPITGGMFERAFRGVGRNDEVFGKKFGDEEQLFMGLLNLSGKPGGKTKLGEGVGEGIDWGHQKDLDLKFDDPRHLEQVMRMGREYTSGMPGTNFGGDPRGLFTQQRSYDRRFRKAGRESGSIWENPGKIIQGVVLAGMAAMTAGALAPLAAGALGIGLASGGIAGMGAGTIGASLATGAIGGAMAGGMTTGLQALTGQDVSWKSGLMNVGLGALGGGAFGGLAHGIHNLGAGAGFTQNWAGGPSSMYIPAGGGYVDVPASMMQGAGGGIVGAGTAAGGKVVMTPSGPMAVQPSGAGSVSYVPISSGNIQQLGIAGGAGGVGGGVSPEENPFAGGGGGKLAKSAATAAVKGGVGAVGQGMEQQAAMQQGLQDAANRGRQSAAQARSTRQGIQSQYPGIFGQQLPDNPFYDPNAYSDLGGVQEDIF